MYIIKNNTIGNLLVGGIELMQHQSIEVPILTAQMELLQSKGMLIIRTIPNVVVPAVNEPLITEPKVEDAQTDNRNFKKFKGGK